jgi:hypothetical protein
MNEFVKHPASDAEITDDVHIPEGKAPICLSLKAHAEGLEAVYKRKHAGFVVPHCILTSDASLISYWRDGVGTELPDGNKYPTISRAFTFLNEAGEMVTVLLPILLTEKHDLGSVDG